MSNDTFLTLTTEILFPSVDTELENETSTTSPEVGSIERSLAADSERNQVLDVSSS